MVVPALLVEIVRKSQRRCDGENLFDRLPLFLARRVERQQQIVQMIPAEHDRRAAAGALQVLPRRQSKVDRVWDAFWAGGIAIGRRGSSAPLSVRTRCGEPSSSAERQLIPAASSYVSRPS
jgi:hypothetical protein